MKFSNFAKYLQKLEDTTKRLEITNIIADLVNDLESTEIEQAIYLSLGYLKAPFETERFNMAEKMVMKSIAGAFEIDPNELDFKYSKSGDLGSVCFDIANKDVVTNTNITHIYDKLYNIAILEGQGSQDAKIEKLSELLADVDALSAKFIVRIVLGTTRLGFTELTVIDALSQYLSGDKRLKKQIENKYNMHPDIGLIAKKLKDRGLEGIKDVKTDTGVPILPQKAQRIPTMEEIIEKMGTVWGEYKFDGTRVQLHLDKTKLIKTTELEQKSLFDPQEERILIKTYTRNLDETTYQFPDIVEAAEEQIDAKSVIIDGEAIGYDKDTGEFLPFQQVMQRKRKHGVQQMAEEIPLKYFAFDILYINGESLLDETLRKRKEILGQVIKKGEVIVVDDYNEIKSVNELKKYFENAREKGLEGLILKKPDAPYMAGARDFTWVKLKVADTQLLDDSVDCVVLGYYFGKGVRARFGIGGFLAGIYDKEDGMYKTITKVGTGLTDNEWIKLKEMADSVKIDKKPKNVVLDKVYEPDVWLEPKIVVELGADEISKSSSHSAEFALRFPRLIKFRTDKKPEDSTEIEEIRYLHQNQKRGYY